MLPVEPAAIFKLVNTDKPDISYNSISSSMPAMPEGSDMESRKTNSYMRSI